jgi:hypothetical protein
MTLCRSIWDTCFQLSNYCIYYLEFYLEVFKIPACLCRQVPLCYNPNKCRCSVQVPASQCTYLEACSAPYLYPPFMFYRTVTNLMLISMLCSSRMRLKQITFFPKKERDISDNTRSIGIPYRRRN